VPKARRHSEDRFIQWGSGEKWTFKTEIKTLKIVHPYSRDQDLSVDNSKPDIAQTNEPWKILTAKISAEQLFTTASHHWLGFVYCIAMYTPWAIKKGATFSFTITLANVEMWTDFNNSFTFGFVDKLWVVPSGADSTLTIFLVLVLPHNLCNIQSSTAPKFCCRTTLWNLNVQLYNVSFIHVQKWKNYWNRSTFAKVIVRIKVAPF